MTALVAEVGTDGTRRAPPLPAALVEVLEVASAGRRRPARAEAPQAHHIGNLPGAGQELALDPSAAAQR